MLCLTRPGVCPKNWPSASFAKLATTIWPPGFSSAARISMIVRQSVAACSAKAASAGASDEHAWCSASGMAHGSLVSQCIAVAENARSTEPGGRHML